MTDGPTQSVPATAAQIAANKVLARGAVNNLLVAGRIQLSGQYFNGDQLISHSPAAADGVANFLASVAQRKLKYNRVRLTLGDGNFVLVASEGSQDGVLTAFYDLFRLENGKIVEFWDCVQVIPPRDQWKNNNAKF